jgi:hypothetical protein
MAIIDHNVNIPGGGIGFRSQQSSAAASVATKRTAGPKRNTRISNSRSCCQALTASTEMLQYARAHHHIAIRSTSSTAISSAVRLSRKRHENAQAKAAHESLRTTKLYDPRFIEVKCVAGNQCPKAFANWQSSATDRSEGFGSTP